MKPKGRPSTYTEDIGLEICELLEHGRSLREICALAAFPARSTVNNWLRDEKHPFWNHYARARNAQAENFADELIAISDDVTNDVTGELQMPNSVAVARAKLRIDTRKWIISKILPKKYGDKVEHEHSGGVTLVHSIPRPERANGS